MGTKQAFGDTQMTAMLKGMIKTEPTVEKKEEKVNDIPEKEEPEVEKKQVMPEERPKKEKNIGTVKAQAKKEMPKDDVITTSFMVSKSKTKKLKNVANDGDKGKTASEMVRLGIDIILAMTNEDYSKLHEYAEKEEVDPAEVVAEAIHAYLS